MNRSLLKTGLFFLFLFVFANPKSAGVNTDSLKALLPVVSQEKQIEILTEIVKATALKNYDTTVVYAQKLLDVASESGNITQTAKAHRYLGRIYNYYHKSDKAFRHLSKALELYRQLNDSITVISLSFDIGKYYLHDTKYDSANEYLLGTVKKCETLLEKKLPPEVQSKIKYTLQNANLQLGHLYVAIEQFGPALEYYRSSLKIRNDIGKKNGIALVLYSLGRYYMTIGEMDSAEYYFRENLQMRDEHKNPIDYSTALIGLSHIYWKRKAYDSAYPLYVKALKLRREVGDVYLTAFTLNNFGGLCDDMHRYEEADAYMKEADSLITVLNNKYLRQQHSLIQSDIYFKRGDYKKSLEYYKLYAAYKDSLVNENTNKKIAKLQTKYETEKKESKIRAQAVKLENQKRIIFLIVIIVLFFAIVLFLLFNRYRWKQKEKENNLKMARMETERRLLRVQMNPHFIFNSLNSIKGYILQKEPKTAASYLDKFAVLMRLTLEHSRQSWVPVEEDIKTLEIYLELEKIRYEDRFDFRIVIDENIDAARTFIPPMLIQPFAENAVKHGFKNLGKRGELIITFERKNDLILCNVSDNGTGRDAASEKENRSQGHKSLGVNLTDERLKLAFGDKNTHIRITDLKSDDGKPAGTLVEIEIPFETD